MFKLRYVILSCPRPVLSLSLSLSCPHPVRPAVGYRELEMLLFLREHVAPPSHCPLLPHFQDIISSWPYLFYYWTSCDVRPDPEGGPAADFGL